MELEELKQLWVETPPVNKQTLSIMEMIQHRTHGPLASLKKSYRRQITVMCLLPLILLLANVNDVSSVLTSVLYWSYVAACLGVITFALYNYQIVKRMQNMDGAVKNNVEQQIALLERRSRVEILGLRGVLLFFILLVEVVPLFQHYRMLDKWHSLPVLLRVTAYAGLFVYQYYVGNRIRERKTGRHLAYLKELVGQMQ